MPLAFIHADRPGAADETLRAVVATLRAQGRALCGVVPQPDAPTGGHPCDRKLISLGTGRAATIHQALGTGSTGCRLDAGALEDIVSAIEAELRGRRPDLLIVNRFGKLESAGRGFAPLIARAIGTGIPVLVGVNSLNRPPFERFAADMATQLPDLPSAVLGWISTLAARQAA